jgi:hypothetical protein
VLVTTPKETNGDAGGPTKIGLINLDASGLTKLVATLKETNGDAGGPTKSGLIKLDASGKINVKVRHLTELDASGKRKVETSENAEICGKKSGKLSS